ncbi:MAG: hypothetical protein IKV16_05420 [Clostridia bacterium]|nr:hypothetical protein [Clostridia bacterium]
MVRNKGVIEKSAYTRNQAGAFVQVKNYIIMRRDNKKFLLLQLSNSFERSVNGIKINLTQLDSAGNTVSNTSYVYDKLSIMPGASYAIPSGLVLDPSCVDFRVDIAYAVSGDYRYVFKNGLSVQTYDPRGYDKRSRSTFRNDTVITKRKFEKSRRAHSSIAWIASIAVLLTVAYATIGLLL